MRKLLPLLVLLLPFPALALTTSEHSLRLESTKDGNVVLGSDQATIERGELYRNVVLLWGRLDVYGEVDEVVVLSGHVAFHQGSRLHKSLVVMGGTFESQPGADVKADSVIAQVPGPLWRALRSVGNAWRDHVDWITRLLGGLVSCLFLWLVGWALFLGFPGLRRQVADDLVRHWPKNLGAGIVGSLATPMGFVMLVLSVVGLLFLPLYLLFLLSAALLSYLGAALWAGHRLLPPKPGRGLNPLGFLLGLAAFQLLWAAPVWGAVLPVLFLWTLGWGALLRSVRLLWR